MIAMESVLMMREKWQTIYETNQSLDDVFIKRYATTPDYHQKNVIELLVEIGEFVNETKCFKYWTVKSPDREKELEELADCITMTLLFYHLLQMPLELSSRIDSENVYEVINHLYQKGTELLEELKEDVVKDILTNLLYLGELFHFEEEEILEAISKKQEITLARLNSNY